MDIPPPSSPAGLLVAPGQGRVIHAFNNELTIQLDGTQTAGLLTLGTLNVPPGAGAPVHYHLSEDEYFIPLEGRVEFFQSGTWTEAAPGTVVFLPQGNVHGFRNVGTEPLKMIVQATPAGFEKFFERCAEVFAKDGPPDMARIVEISAEHGIYYPEMAG